jgi:branched-chain amino acid transport system substrate-binding protein
MFGTAFFAGVAILAPWVGRVEVAEAQPPIRIGASVSQTGSLAAPGRNMLRGYQLCVKHANATGGLLGRQIVEAGG